MKIGLEGSTFFMENFSTHHQGSFQLDWQKAHVWSASNLQPLARQPVDRMLVVCKPGAQASCLLVTFVVNNFELSLSQHRTECQSLTLNHFKLPVLEPFTDDVNWNASHQRSICFHIDCTCMMYGSMWPVMRGKGDLGKFVSVGILGISAPVVSALIACQRFQSQDTGKSSRVRFLP